MSTPMESYARAREATLRAALDSLRAERRLMDDDGSVPVSSAADGALSLAAANLARAVDDLPVQHQPKGWGTLADAGRTS